MEELITPKGDFGNNIGTSLKDAAGDAVNLTGKTVTLKLWRPAAPGTLVLNEACSVDDPVAGTWHYAVQEHDFDIATTYVGELEITASGVKESSKSIRLVVTESG